MQFGYANCPTVRIKHGWIARRAMAEINKIKNDPVYAQRCVNGDPKTLDRLMNLHKRVVKGYLWEVAKEEVKTYCLAAVYPHFQEHMFWK